MIFSIVKWMFWLTAGGVLVLCLALTFDGGDSKFSDLLALALCAGILAFPAWFIHRSEK